MAHSLSIAKASLLASCLRPDPTKLSRDELSQFHDLLETSISQCTPRNIQNTKQWLLQHILQSPARTAAFSKYLASLSKNIDFLPSESVHVRACRRQLHLLYVLNDIFHHVKYHAKEDHLRENVREHIQSILPVLFAKALEEKKSRTTKRLNDLLDIWAKEKYFDHGQIAALRDTLQPGSTTDSKPGEESAEVKQPKETPWILPPTHGDPTAPFFDLPAANLMPHILPNIVRPIRPDAVRPLQLNPGPADESLVNAMKDFLRDIKSIDDPYGVLEDEGIVADIDEMGQISYRNEADDVVGDTYYGWSRAFCEKMKSRGKKGARGRGDNGKSLRSRSRSSDSRSRSYSRSRSRSRSRCPRKRRRHYSTSHSRSRSRSRSHSRSRSRSPYHNDVSPPCRGFATYSAQRPNPPKPSQAHAYPGDADPPRFQDTPHQHHHHSQQRTQSSSAIPPPPPFPHQQGPGPGPGQYPYIQPHSSTSPPPKPPNWNGPWPPPPPSPPGSGFAGGAGVGVPNMMIPPGPPPPPPSHQGYGNGDGSRGGGGYGRR